MTKKKRQQKKSAQMQFLYRLCSGEQSVDYWRIDEDVRLEHVQRLGVLRNRLIVIVLFCFMFCVCVCCVLCVCACGSAFILG